MSMTKKSKLLSEGEVADIFGVDQSTMRRWRYEGSGPHFIKLGGAKGAIRYRDEDINDHLSANRFKSTFEYYQGVEL